jgi:hypothetical protein
VELSFAESATEWRKIPKESVAPTVLILFVTANHGLAPVAKVVAAPRLGSDALRATICERMHAVANFFFLIE